MQNRDNADDKILEGFLSTLSRNEDKKFENPITRFSGELDLGDASLQAEHGNILMLQLKKIATEASLSLKI